TLRKSKFNRLLRVEEYEQAFQKLLALTNELKEEQKVTEEGIRRLANQTEGIAEKSDELDAIRDTRATLATELVRLLGEADAVRHQVEELDAKKKSLDDRALALHMAEERARQAKMRAEDDRRERDAAATAAATCAR